MSAAVSAICSGTVAERSSFCLELAVRRRRVFAHRGQRLESLVPDPRVGERERRCPRLERQRLGGDAGRLLPAVLRPPRDHRHEARGDGDRQGRCRAATRSRVARPEPLEEVPEPEIEVFVGLSHGGSLDVRSKPRRLSFVASMSEVFDGIQTFFEELADVEWTALAIACGLQLARLFARSIAWRSIIAAAYPETRVPLGHVTGAYFAGVGVNAIAPARAGDVVKLVLVKHEVQGTTYTTLAPTLIVETIFDMVVAARSSSSGRSSRECCRPST